MFSLATKLLPAQLKRRRLGIRAARSKIYTYWIMKYHIYVDQVYTDDDGELEFPGSSALVVEKVCLRGIMVSAWLDGMECMDLFVFTHLKTYEWFRV